METKSGINTPSISLPKGGGAIRGIGETFQPNLFTGTGNFSIPISTSPGREGFGPQLTLQYSTGNGNGPFGLGWRLSIPRITRKTEKGLPTYTDKDVFVMSGAEDLVPCLKEIDDPENPGQKIWVPEDTIERGPFNAYRYRPRTEGLFARIEKWVHKETKDVHWRATTKENITSVYGRTEAARIIDPKTEDKPHREQHVFEWLLEETFDAKGNHILYEYARDDPDLYLGKIYEENRTYCQRYIRRIYYGNLPDPLIDENGDPATYPNGDPIGHLKRGTDHNNPVNQTDRHYSFELLFDYGDWDFPHYKPFLERTVAERVQAGVHPDPNTIEQQELFGPDPSQSDADNRIPVRADTFSTFRSGFEIRILRTCRRVLMIHHFKELGGPTVVRSTDFEYNQNPDTLLCFLASAAVTGYRKDGDEYIQTTMPQVTFKYSEFKPQAQRYQSVTAEGNDLPPLALNNPNFTLMDLFGNALPDVFNTTPNGYYYWENMGEGKIDRRHPQHTVPAGVELADAHVAIGDMGGDGLPDLVVEGPMYGFYEATSDGSWKPFKRFDDFPSFSLADPNLRLVDLTGDGLSDALVTLDHQFLWYPCKGEEGFDAPQVIERKRDLDLFPDVYFDDPTGRVRLADMTGDGLNDIVMVHNGRIDYWPNCGYGKFGERITMTNTPILSYGFDPRRLFLVDLDGTDCADLVYVDFGKVQFWFNQSGNGWSDGQTIDGTPAVTDFTAVQFADFLGTGTATLMWSYDHNGQPGGNYKILDFCGGVKPNLLIEMDNNIGATTRVQYASSSKFYLEDKKNGEPWVTNLPFPVQVLEKTESIDYISKTKLVTTYKYHHGYYDGREREFRGFGRVDQFDTEVFTTFAKSDLHDGEGLFTNNHQAYHVPPALTKNWFHTGIYFDENLPSSSGVFYDEEDMMAAYREEFYQEVPQAFQLEDHEIEPTNTLHEAYRALRGSLIRSETYALDGTDQARHPYTVTENRYCVKQLQPEGENNHEVFLTLQKYSLSYHYERVPDDPRIAHQINLNYDDYGNLLESVAISYPRRIPLDDDNGDPYREQASTKAIYTFSQFINEDSKTGHYYVGLPCETKAFEVLGLNFFWLEDNDTVTPLDATVFDEVKDKNEYETYEYQPPENLIGLKKRIIEWTRQYYGKDADPGQIDPIADLSHRLAFGRIESLALPYESYQAAFTRDFIENLLPLNISDRELQNESGYHRETQAEPEPNHDSDITELWWIPSGRQSFNEEKFYLSEKAQDPFGNKASVTFDDYSFLITTSTDAGGNIITAENDYRMLQPHQVTDPNENISQVKFDALGLVIGTAVMGEDKNGNIIGDSVDDFVANLGQQDIDNHISKPLNDPHAILKKATTRLVYDLHRYIRNGQPNVVYTLERETHVSEENGIPSKIRHSFVYSDGFGREVQTKVQAEPGKVGGNDIPHRWVGTGTKIFNNKGKQVQQFEPFFSDTHEFGIEQHGVSPILFYDPLERIVCTLHPNHTYEKVVFDAWKQATWDTNDTIHTAFRYDPQSPNSLPDHIYNPINDPDVGNFFTNLPTQDFWPTWFNLRMDPARGLEKWPIADEHGNPLPNGVQKRNEKIRKAEKDAAQKASQHAGTPTVTHLDTLGRVFLTIADNGRDETGKDNFFNTYVELDIEGNDTNITDPRGFTAFEHTFDMVGRKLKVNSKDAGDRTSLTDISGENPWYVWDANGNEIKTEYDALRRPIEVWVNKDGTTRLVNHTQYGDEAGVIEAVKYNLRGQVYKVLDDAGVITNREYDFKGNLIEGNRKLLQNYKLEADWNTMSTSDLETDTYPTINKYDALNRITASTTPDGSIQKQIYNEANLLETVKIRIMGEPSDRDFVKNINYNARGQREAIEYGNGVTTIYTYDPETFRIATVLCKKADRTLLQDLRYTYDPVGNVTRIHDAAFQTVFNHNQRIDPINQFKYDATNRLIEAKGREHGSMTACHYQTKGNKHTEFITLSDQPVNNGQALHNYTQYFLYDEGGNITQIRHVGRSGWTRNQEYHDTRNRLKKSVANQTFCAGEVNFEFPHDNNGNIKKMPHLREIKWDYANRLIEVETNLQTNNTSDRVYYRYDGGGQRVRKEIEHGNTRSEERIYIDGFEIYRKQNGTGSTLKRTTLHVMDDTRRVAIIDRKISGQGTDLRVRFQLNNHLGSSLLEVDENAKEISYEEYYPYGGTSYLAGESWAEVKRKRFRYSGKERDDETGLYYYGARYYAPWLGRWMSCDPMGRIDSISLYKFALNNPILNIDPGGTVSKDFKSVMPDISKIVQESPSFVEAYSKSAKRIKITEGHLPRGQLGSTGRVEPDVKVLEREKITNPASLVLVKIDLSQTKELFKTVSTIVHEYAHASSVLERGFTLSEAAPLLPYEKFRALRMQSEFEAFEFQTNVLNEIAENYPVSREVVEQIIKAESIMKALSQGKTERAITLVRERYEDKIRQEFKSEMEGFSRLTEKEMLFMRKQLTPKLDNIEKSTWSDIEHRWERPSGTATKAD